MASTSPRRAQLLQSIGVPFRLAPVDWEEPPPTPDEERDPAAYVERLARCKAEKCAVPAVEPDAGVLVLAADTVVWHRQRILNKPRDEAEARAMLAALQGHTHRVLTGVCLRVCRAGQADGYCVEHETTAVTFCPTGASWIARYVATGEPMDKAGAYAAQGLGAVLIERIEGDFSNVVGLPLTRLARLLERAGAPVENWWPQTAMPQVGEQ